MSTDDYDVIVLGGGSAGTNVAWYARDRGLRVVLVEAELLGGECSYWACIPSKALLAPPDAVAAARRLPGADAAVGGDVDVDAVLSRRDQLISHLDDAGQAEWMADIGADLVRGRGRITDARTVEVSTEDGSRRVLRAARAVVIATGSQPSSPPVGGLDEVETWDNRDATTSERIPERLVVLGGGAVGCEMAQAHRRLGASAVTVIEMADHIIDSLDPWVGERLAEAFADEGIRVLTGRSADRVEREQDNGEVTVTLDDGSTVVGDELLVATGRRFATDELGLDSVGIDVDGPVTVDDHLRVDGTDWLYAVGDVNGRVLLTHQGKYQARIAADVIAGDDRTAWADGSAVPQAIFTDPQVASVGVSEKDAREQDLPVKVVAVALDSVAAAKLANTSGHAQLVIDDDRRVVVGATFVGPDTAELLHAATIAIVGEVPIATLWHAVPAFPTVSEVWLRLLEADRDLIG